MPISKNTSYQIIVTSNDAYALFRKAIDIVGKNEAIFLLPLGLNGEVLKEPILISQGTNVGVSSIRLGDILAMAYKLDAKAFIIAHNHPSGNPKPSQADIEFTHALKNICERLENIQFIDHLIIGSSDSANGFGFVSITESIE
jgi:DNA repair protein RadC